MCSQPSYSNDDYGVNGYNDFVEKHYFYVRLTPEIDEINRIGRHSSNSMFTEFLIKGFFSITVLIYSSLMCKI